MTEIFTVERRGITVDTTIFVGTLEAAKEYAHDRTVPKPVTPEPPWGMWMYTRDSDGYHDFAVVRWEIGTDKGEDVGSFTAGKGRGCAGGEYRWVDGVAP